jgi:hypothetical protein
MSQARVLHCAYFLNGVVYVFGGLLLTTAEKYDEQRWESLASLPISSIFGFNYTVDCLDEKLFIACNVSD